MKCWSGCNPYWGAGSLPSRGAWIEIAAGSSSASVAVCRSPHGERGLKSHGPSIVIILLQSLPSRGAWIEIPLADSFRRKWSHRSLPSRGAWIEISRGSFSGRKSSCRSPHGERGLKSLWAAWAEISASSLPSRGAWIEILLPLHICQGAGEVAPLTGSVD